jgi:hypothetical protein
MKEDVEPDPYVLKRRRLGFVLTAVAMMLIALGIVWSYQRDGRGAAGLDASASAVAGTRTPGSVGTSGAGVAPDATDGGGPPAIVPPTVIQELDTITGSVDGQQLIGRRVDLHVTVHSVPNEVAFWIGGKDNRLLVVGRDNRDRKQRQLGLPPRHDISPVHAGQQATISGSVQRVPKAEEMYSWRLTEPDYAELLDRKMYIRADTVTTDGHGTHENGI